MENVFMFGQARLRRDRFCYETESSKDSEASLFWCDQELFRVFHIYPWPPGLAYVHTSPKICDLCRNMDVCISYLCSVMEKLVPTCGVLFCGLIESTEPLALYVFTKESRLQMWFTFFFYRSKFTVSVLLVKFVVMCIMRPFVAGLPSDLLWIGILVRGRVKWKP